MDTMKALDDLARRARLESVPETDVSAAVVARIRAGEGARARVLSLSLIAAASAVAAAVLLALALQAWTSAADPLIEIAAPLQVGSL